MRHLFIINPAAGKKKSTKQLEKLLHDLEEPWEAVYTEKEGDAQRFAREAAERGEPVRIYACGGDGTLNEVVNGAAGFPNAAITNVPKGTGNDFLKIFGPDYREQFFNLPALMKGPQTPIDLIDCNGKLGIDIVCAGVDARIAADVHRYKGWTFVSGIGAYVLALLENLVLKGISSPMTVRMGEQLWTGKTTVLCICNGRYYGGGFMPVGDAMPDDGVLDMLLIRGLPRLTFARLVGQYAKGRYRDYPELVREFHGQSISFSSPMQITVVVDGEVMKGTDFIVCLSEKKVNFFYPEGATYQLKEHKLSTQSSDL